MERKKERERKAERQTEATFRRRQKERKTEIQIRLRGIKLDIFTILFLTMLLLTFNKAIHDLTGRHTKTRNKRNKTTDHV